MNIKDIASHREALRDRKREIAAEEKALNEEIATIDEQLFALLDEQGVDRLSTNGITLSISENVVANVQDWQAVYDYVAQTGNFQLFERRMSSTAYREMLAVNDGQPVPGTEPFTKRSINMRIVR